MYIGLALFTAHSVQVEMCAFRSTATMTSESVTDYRTFRTPHEDDTCGQHRVAKRTFIYVWPISSLGASMRFCFFVNIYISHGFQLFPYYLLVQLRNNFMSWGDQEIRF